MNDTVDDISPLGRVGRRAIALARTIAAVIGVLVPAIIAAVVAYRTAAIDTEARVQATKNKSEAGYQVVKEYSQTQGQRIGELEATVRSLVAQQQHPPAPAKRGARRPAALPTPAAPKVPKALPADLDKAERQVYRGVAATVTPAADAAPR